MRSKIMPLSIVLVLSLLATTSLALDVNYGNWEHTVRMEAKGLPFSPAPIVTSECLTEEDILPKAVSEGDQKCTMVESSVIGNTVSWTMECTSEAGKSNSKGTITYKGDTYSGKVKMVANGMKMDSSLSGKRLGACK